MPGIAANVSAICCSSSGLPFAPGTFMRMRPGTWWATLNLSFVMARQRPTTVATTPSRRGHGRTRRGFRWGSLPVALGVDFSDDVVNLFLHLGDHFAGFLSHLVGAADGRSNQRIYRASDLR